MNILRQFNPLFGKRASLAITGPLIGWGFWYNSRHNSNCWPNTQLSLRKASLDVQPFTADWFKPFVFLRPHYTKAEPVTKSEDWSVVLGSGFIVDSEGVVVTSNLVYQDFDYLWIIMSDGTQVKGKVEAVLPEFGLVYIQIPLDKKPGGKGWPTVQWNNGPNPGVGTRVYHVGNPRFNVFNTVVKGLISGQTVKGERITVMCAPNADYITFSAAVTSSDFGSALVDSKGNVIGMTAHTDSRKCFCLPSSLIKQKLNEKKPEFNKPKPAEKMNAFGLITVWLDDNTRQDLTRFAQKHNQTLPNVNGMCVLGTHIEFDWKTNIEQFDVITHIDNQAVNSEFEFYKFLDIKPSVRVTVRKHGTDGQPQPQQPLVVDIKSSKKEWTIV